MIVEFLCGLRVDDFHLVPHVQIGDELTAEDSGLLFLGALCKMVAHGNQIWIETGERRPFIAFANCKSLAFGNCVMAATK